MKTKPLIFSGILIAMLSALADNAGFWLGTSKAMLKHQSLEFPRSIWNAMSPFVGPFGKSSRMILVRDGKCFVINGAKDLDVVRDFPVLPGDCIQKFAENDLKEWNLPVVEGTEAVAILVAEEKSRALHTNGVSQEQTPSVNLPKSGAASTSPVLAQRINSSPTQTAPALPNEEPTSSTPWSIIVILIVAAIGLLWLLLKKRK